MSLLPVEDALAQIMADTAPLPNESVPIADADDRVLGGDLAATRDQPPFDASSMDGYAVRAADVAKLPAVLQVIGEAAAGRGFDGEVAPQSAVRIFTGAPIPTNADAIVIQENTQRHNDQVKGDQVKVVDGTPDPSHVRRRGFDYNAGTVLLQAGTHLSPRTITLAAAMGHSHFPVVRKPRVAIIATGDELVLPGTVPTADQIVCSNPYGVAAIARRAGAAVEFLGIAKDTRADLNAHFDRAAHADIVVTIGGASVGDHDLVGPVLEDRGVALDFWKVAMRPGKPLTFARAENSRFLGLPGNPVSALVCARVFLAPLVNVLSGRPSETSAPMPIALSAPLEANGPRKHYMRAIVERDRNGQASVAALTSQDSSLLTRLAAANALIVREAKAPAAQIGEVVDVLMLDF